MALVWIVATALMMRAGTAQPEPPCTLIGPARDMIDTFERFTLWDHSSPMIAWRRERGITDGMETAYVDNVTVCRRALEAIRTSDRVHASWVSVWHIGRVYIVGVNDHHGSTFILDESFQVLERFIGLN